MPLRGDHAAWCREKLDFFCAVINNLDRERLKAELEGCETEEDAAGLMHSLLWLQDSNNTIYPGGAAANPPPHQQDLQGDQAFPQGHQLQYAEVDDPPAHQPHHHNQDDQNAHMNPIDAALALRNIIHSVHQRQQEEEEEEEDEEEEEEEVNHENYGYPPMAVCEHRVLEASAYSEDDTHQPQLMEEHEHQQQGYEEIHDEPLRRFHSEPNLARDVADANDLREPPKTPPTDHPSDSEDQDIFGNKNFEGLFEDQEWGEASEPIHNHKRKRENTPSASDDGDADENTEPIEPISERDESDPYFDADEPSADDFVDVEEASLEEDLGMLFAAEDNNKPVPDDLEVEGATGGHDDTKDDERFAQELSQALMEEDRARMESDEQMARELAEQMEMEERQREAADEEMARKLANEFREEIEQQQLTPPPPQLQVNNPPQDITEEVEEEDYSMFMAEEENVDAEEEMRLMEELAIEKIHKEEEDEKAGRVAALINMFPDADPKYLEER